MRPWDITGRDLFQNAPLCSGNSGSGSKKCFCDVVSNSSQWKHDEGHLTNKGRLPVTKINFGGLGQRSEQPREAKFQLGPLYCVGADPGDIGGGGQPGLGGSPASCRDLWLRGYNQVRPLFLITLFLLTFRFVFLGKNAEFVTRLERVSLFILFYR